MFAQARCRPLVHGVRDRHRCRREHQPLSAPPRSHAFACALDIHAGLGLAVAPGRDANEGVARAAAASREPVRVVQELGSGARAPRSDRLRYPRARPGIRRAGQDRADRAGGAQRRAQNHRGMHARGQRVRGPVSGRAEAPRALPHPRRTDAGETRGFEGVSCGLGAVAVRRRYAHVGRLREAAFEDTRPARRQPAADRAPALAAAGGLRTRQRGPLRARLRRLHAFHVAYPPLSRPAHPSLRQSVPRRHALPAGRRIVAGARRALLADRAPRRRRDARCRELAQVLFHAGPRR